MTASIRSNPVGRPSDNSKLALAIAFFGVILPIVAIIVEMNFRICATSCFDPFPSNFHVMLFALIPLGNALVLLSMRRDLSDHYAFLCLLNGMSAGIGLTYSLMFLPLLPVSLLLILAFGFGLLGLTPMTSLLSTIGAGKIICDQAKIHDTYFDPEHSKHLGHLLVIASIIAIELPSTLTRVHLFMASEPATAAEGLDWLRRNGSQEVMLRACYERSGRATDVLGSLYECGHAMNVETAREIFYQVTGKPYNSVPIPMGARATMQHAQVAINGALIQDEFDLDTGIAGQSVSSVARGLTLTQSKITGELIPGTADAVLDCVFELNNASAYDREARAVLKVPPNAVVNKVSLEIDGKKLESHIQVREVARATYRSGIFTGRDPLLVSWCGPDSLLVQCYPIHKQSKATVTIGMVAPLYPEAQDRGSLWLPFFQEQNFAVKAIPKVEMYSRSKLESNASDLAVTNSDGRYCISGDLAKSKTRCDNLRFTVPINLAASPSSCLSLASSQARFVKAEESIVPYSQRKPEHICVLIDGSVNLAQYKEQIVSGLEKAKPDVDTNIEIVSDIRALQSGHVEPGGVVEIKPDPARAARENRILRGLVPFVPGSGLLSGQANSGFDRELEGLRAASFVGGQDNSTQLEAVVRRYAEGENSIVVWIHGAQPLAKRNNLIGRILNLRKDLPLVYDLQVEPGTNQILDGVDFSTSLVRVPTSGDLQNDIVQLFGRLLCQHTYYCLVRTGDPGSGARLAADANRAGAVSFSTNDPVTTLWARDLVTGIGRRCSPTQLHEANNLALKFNIVTPISSAIVHDPNPMLTLDKSPPSSMPRHRFRRIGALLQNFGDGVGMQQRAAFKADVSRLDSLKNKSVISEEVAEDVKVANAASAPPNPGSGQDAFSTTAAQGAMGYGAQGATGYGAQSASSWAQRAGTSHSVRMEGAGNSGGQSQSLQDEQMQKDQVAVRPQVNAHSIASELPSISGATAPAPASPAFSQASDDLEADAKPAPEPGVWLLFVISALMVGGALLFRLRRRVSSSN